MSQTIQKSDGSLITINDNAIDTTYSIQLIGKNRPNYGAAINQNSFRLMENFANITSPLNPQNGQLWWDDAGSLHIYDSTRWKYIGSTTPSSDEPVNPVTGDQWFDLINDQLKVFNGTDWILVGPSDSSFVTLNGFVTEKFTVSSTDYYVASMYANGTRLAILSKDTFNANISNFGNVLITPGINYNTTITGVATNNGNIVSSKITNSGNLTSGDTSITGNLQVTGNVVINNITANSCIFSNLAVTSNITANIVSATSIIGNITTVAQPHITSVGTLTSLTVTGNVTAGNVGTTTMSIGGLQVTLGANDSAGVGFRLLRVINA